MAMRSKETPFERRERLNLETAIALSTTSNMTSQIGCDSLGGINPLKQPTGSPRFIPNSQSDEDIIQDFTVRDSSASSKQSPPTTGILPVQTSSMDPGLPAESRGPGWSMDKFHASTSSTTDQSTHLKPKQLSNSSSSSIHTPQTPILLATSSASTSNNLTTTSRPKPRPPRLDAASIEQARARLKLRESVYSAINPTSSSTIEQSLQDPFHPTRVKPKPSEVPQQAKVPAGNVPQQTPVEICPIRLSPIASDRPTLPQSPENSNFEGSSRQELPGAQVPSLTKKRKVKAQDKLETELLRGSAGAKAKMDGDGKRVRKQSAAGKASAKSLQILINLSQSSDDIGHAKPQPRHPIISGDSEKTPRRRIYRNGWVLASDPDPEPELETRGGVPVINRDQAGGSIHESPQLNLAPPPAPASKALTSQPFLEVVSSPLSSPSGFSADETTSKASKLPKPPVIPKKRVPKKKPPLKPKATKNRKRLIVIPPAVPNDRVSPVPLEGHPAGETTLDKTNSTCNLPDIQDAQQEPETLEEVDKPRSNSPAQSKTRQSPRRTAGSSSDIVSIDTLATGDPMAAIDKITSLDKSRIPGPSTVDPPQDLAEGDKPKNENGKRSKIKNRKGMSLAESLAITNPKIKRGIRIGLPREDKYRLHININPNPPVQKQVKKKLKVKRGEYDSGEDDAHSKNSGSSESEDPDQKKSGKSSKSKKRHSDEDVDGEEGTKEDDCHEEY